MEAPIRPHTISIFAYQPSLRQTAVATIAQDCRVCRSSETPLDRIMSGFNELPGWLAEQPAGQLGEVIIKGREIIDRTEAMAAEATRRFEKAGGYKADGFLGMVPWLRVKGKLSGGAAVGRPGSNRRSARRRGRGDRPYCARAVCQAGQGRHENSGTAARRWPGRALPGGNRPWASGRCRSTPAADHQGQPRYAGWYRRRSGR